MLAKRMIPGLDVSGGRVEKSVNSVNASRNSAAVKNPDLIRAGAERSGNQCLMPAARGIPVRSLWSEKQ